MANIILRELEFSHMFSYGANNKIRFDENRITQLTAPNGSGKTSLALILQELLFSKNVKGIKKADILNRFSGAKKWSASLTFSIDNNDYILFVERIGDSSKVKLLENGKDISEHKIPDTYKILQKKFNSFEIFSQLTYQSSTDLLEFIKATDTNRKKFLVNLFNLERYVEIGENLKIKITESEKKIIALEGELSGVIRFLTENIIKDKQISKPTIEVDSELYKKRDSLKAELDNHKSLCGKIDKNNLYIKERDNLVFDMGLIEPSAPAEAQKVLVESQAEFQVAKSKILDLEKQLKNLELADTCYACGQHIDNSKAVEMAINIKSEIPNWESSRDYLKIKIDNATIEVQNYNKELKLFQINQKAIERFEQLSQLIDKDIPKIYPNYSAIELEFNIVIKELQLVEKQKRDIELHNENVKLFNAKIDTLIDQRRQFLARQQLLESDIIQEKSRLKYRNILRKAFSTSGIIAYKLENLTKELEETINSYLAELSDGQFQIVFRLEGEKLNIIVINNGKESPIETVSGGEFSRIQTAILLAIRNVLSKLGGSRINLLFLDEVTGVLDDAGKEKLVEILQEEDLNVFLISHDFSHPLIEKVNIIKEKNISRIE